MVQVRYLIETKEQKIQKKFEPIVLVKTWIKLLLLKLCEEFAYPKLKVSFILSHLQILIGFLIANKTFSIIRISTHT